MPENQTAIRGLITAIRESLSLKLGVLYGLFSILLISLFWVALGQNQSGIIAENSFDRVKILSLKTVRVFREYEDFFAKFKLKKDKKKKKKTLSKKSASAFSSMASRIPSELSHHLFFDIKGNILWSADSARSRKKVEPFHYRNALKALQNLAVSGANVYVTPRPGTSEFFVTIPVETKKGENFFWVSKYQATELSESFSKQLRFILLIILTVIFLQAIYIALVRFRIIKRLKEIITTAGTMHAMNKAASEDAAAGATVAEAGESVSKSGDELDFLRAEIISAEIEIQQKSHLLEETHLALKVFNNTIQKELRMASEIQQGLIPRQKKLGRATAAVYYAPLEEVSGDYFGFFERGESGDYYIMADVSGHGIPAALITMMTQVQMSALTPADLEPGKLLTAMNANVAARITTSDYFTAFLVRLKPDLTLEYSNASHQKTIILRRSENAIEELDTNGFFIGAMEDLPMEHETKKTRLKVGDRIILYSDGIVEGMNPDREEFGDQRFKEDILSTKSMSPEEAVRAIIEDVDAFAEGEPRKDDYTLIILEIDEEGADAN